MTITSKGDTTWIQGKTITVTDAMGDQLIATRYDDHALILTTDQKPRANPLHRCGPVVKLGSEALKAIANLFSEGR